MENRIKNFIDKRYTQLVLLSTILFIVSLLGYSSGFFTGSFPKKFTILPSSLNSQDSLFEAASYSDITETDGASNITPLTQDSAKLQYRYTINKGYEYPYAGISLYSNINNPKISSLLDISKYTHLYLDITAENSEQEQIYIKPVIPGFTKSPLHKGTRGYLRYDLSLNNGSFTGAIPLSDFFTPDWWFANHKVTKNDLAAPDLSQVVELVFQNSDTAPIGKEVAVSIREITFYRNTTTESLTVVLIYLIALILLSSAKFIKLPTSEFEDDGTEKIIISYDRVEIEDEQNNDLQRITDFIASNYSNPDFSVEQLAKGAGVSTSRIPTLLKKQYSMNFKQYLNTVRITEAKRLLLETDHQIVTIAHSVGYNNIPHFNRTFKQVTGLSPKKYRENPEEAIDNRPGSVQNN